MIDRIFLECVDCGYETRYYPEAFRHEREEHHTMRELENER